MIKHLPTKISFLNLKTDTLLIYSGHLFFFVLLLFSIYFYKERILFTDSAFQYFKIINFEKINIEASRYGAILPQLPTVLFSKLGLNIKLLPIIFSCSFVLLYYAIYVITVHLLKNAETGFIILLVLTACISQSFFHPVTETHQSPCFYYASLRGLTIQKLSLCFHPACSGRFSYQHFFFSTSGSVVYKCFCYWLCCYY